MAGKLIPIPSPHSLSYQPHHYTNINSTRPPLIKPFSKANKAKLIPLCSASPSSSPSLVEEDETNNSPLSASTQAGISIEDANKLPPRISGLARANPHPPGFATAPKH